MKIILRSFIILFTATLSYGQENSFLNFTVADGLPSTEVYHVIQDKKGFIWFATDNGVVKFDGGSFEVINSSLGLSDPVVFGLHEDELGRIWFRTFTGKLSYYLDGKVEKYQFNDSITQFTNDRIVSDLYIDSLKQLWITAADLFIKMDKTGNYKFEKVGQHRIHFHELNKEKYLLAFSGPTGSIDTAYINNNNLTIHQTDTSESFSLIAKVRWGNQLYFSLNHNVYKYDGSIKKVFTAPSSIISLSLDQENKLWIGNLTHGVHCVNDTTFKNIIAIKELEGKSVTSVLQDPEKGYWITTLEKGVYYFPDFLIQSYPLSSPTKIKSVISTDNFLITTGYSGNVTALDNRSNEVLWETKLNMPIITAFADKNNHVWVSTTGETLILNERGDIVRRNLPPSIVDFTANSSYVYGISNKGVYKFNLMGKLLSQKLLNIQFRNIKLNRSEIYFGGRNGLFLFDSAFNYVRELKSFSDIKVSNVTALNDSLLLISTIGNGFMLLNKQNEQITSYNQQHGFIANNIYTVLNLNSHIWLGTEKGIALCDKNSLIQGDPKFNFITKRSGLFNDKVNFLAKVEDKIWAFSDEGYAKLPINKLNFSNTHPVGYIKEIVINNKKIDLKNTLNLKYLENNIQIKTGFISYNNQNIFTRFRLVTNEPWSPSVDWVYSFNSLNPGKYDFQVEYSIDNLNWYPAAMNLKFEIHPPWWGTWYFFLIIGIFILLIGIVIFRKTVAQYKERNQYLGLINEQQKRLLKAEIDATERERTRIAKDLHDGIGMDLVSIKFLTNQLEKKSEDKTAKEIQRQLEKTISEIKNIIYGLTPSGLQLFGLSHGIENYLSMIKRKHPMEIHFAFEGEEVKDEQIGAIVFRIIQELVTNSIKHSQCENINIKISVYSTFIQITFKDNGTGFDPDTIIPGLGLSNIRSRVESVLGQINFKSDKSGASYSINLPLRE